MWLDPDGALEPNAISDTGGFYRAVVTAPLVLGRWYWLVLELRRASAPAVGDGLMKFYIDGVLGGTASGIQNYSTCATLDKLELGCHYYARNGLAADFDELKLTDAYPEPFVPPPAGELPSARRTIILYGPSADSMAFADWAAAAMGVPPCNLVRLGSAASTEALASYALVQSQLEIPLAAFWATNPTVAANATCFLLGHGVPGTFTHAGLQYSVTSRLMSVGQAFNPRSTNPLRQVGAAQRLTVTALRASGRYLAGRIDAASLPAAQAMLQRSLDMAAIQPASGDSRLFIADDGLRSSLACQALRLPVETMPAEEFTHDAAIIGDFAGLEFASSAGPRAVVVDTAASSAAGLRGGAAPCREAIAAGYAAAIGACGAAESLDEGMFLDMLRIGGTLAEAAAAAAWWLDSGMVAAGNPLMTVAFPRAGYNLYTGPSVGAIDWASPIACMPADAEQVQLSVHATPSSCQVIAARAVSAGGVEETNTHILTSLEFDAQGRLVPGLAAPTELSARLLPDGSVVLDFSYVRQAGWAGSEEFQVVSDFGTGVLDVDHPLLIAPAGEDPLEVQLQLGSIQLPALLAVRAMAATQAGPLSDPIVVPAPAGAAPIVVEVSQ